jgi:hypothetical protein
MFSDTIGVFQNQIGVQKRESWSYFYNTADNVTPKRSV